MIGLGALARRWPFRRRQSPGDVQVVTVQETRTRAPAFYIGQVVLVRPLELEQPHAGPTPVRITRFTREKLEVEWLTDAEFQKLVRDREGALTRRRGRRGAP